MINLTVSIEKIKIKTQDNIDLLGWYHKKKSSVIIKQLFFCMAMQGSLAKQNT